MNLLADNGEAGVSFLFVLVLGAYFLPTLIAKFNKHPHGNGIAVLNIFLGWTLLGWTLLG